MACRPRQSPDILGISSQLYDPASSNPGNAMTSRTASMTPSSDINAPVMTLAATNTSLVSTSNTVISKYPVPFISHLPTALTSLVIPTLFNYFAAISGRYSTFIQLLNDYLLLINFIYHCRNPFKGSRKTLGSFQCRSFPYFLHSGIPHNSS